MAAVPAPAEIFDRAGQEGERRLDQSLLELVSISFMAGFTIVFGLIALGIVEAIVEPRFGKIAKLAGALAVMMGVVTAGTLIGGLGLVTLTQFTQAMGPASPATDP